MDRSQAGAGGSQVGRPGTASYELAVCDSSARTARRLVREELSGSSDTVIEVAELLISELVANAVRHARSSPAIQIEIDPASVHVAVTDESRLPPQVQRAAETAGSGRGLFLVDALAASWGWSRTDQGKRVWFTL